VRVASTVEPNRESSAIMQQQYKKYRRIYPALRSMREESSASHTA